MFNLFNNTNDTITVTTVVTGRWRLADEQQQVQNN